MCMPNVNMKIDENGEICIKSPVLFKKWVHYLEKFEY
jgi:long-subunit acyl-CoA synthetase (AMP-forming)